MYLNSFDTSQWLPLEWTLSLSSSPFHIFNLSLHSVFSLSLSFCPSLVSVSYSRSSLLILFLSFCHSLSPSHTLSLSLLFSFSLVWSFFVSVHSLSRSYYLSLSPSLIYSHFLSTFYIFSLYKSLNLFLFHFLSLYLP